MAGGVMVIMTASEPVLNELTRQADGRKVGPILEDDAPGVTLHFGPRHLATHAAHHPDRPHGFRAVHNTLSGQGTAEDNLAQLEKSLDRLSRGGRW